MRAALASVLLLGAAFSAGPRTSVDPDVAAPRLPDAPAELDLFLEASESRYPGIVPGTEKRILWADPGAPSRTDYAVVYLHGFTATHRESAPLTERLAHELRANAYLTRLTGHGRTPEALGEAEAGQWLRDAAEAMEIGRRIGRRTILMGISTGGMLATWAAAHPEWREGIAALVLISPNYAMADRRAWVLDLPWGGVIARLVQGPEHGFEPRNELHRRYWTERYPTRVLLELGALVRIVDAGLMGRISAPALMFLSPRDRVIDPGVAERRFGELGSAERRLVRVSEIAGSGEHVLAGDILAPGRTSAVLSEILSFVRDLEE